MTQPNPHLLHLVTLLALQILVQEQQVGQSVELPPVELPPVARLQAAVRLFLFLALLRHLGRALELHVAVVGRSQIQS